MADCPVCTEKKTFEDEKVITITMPNGLLVSPKKHLPILEQTPDFVIDKVFIKANHELLQMFEKGAQGTNLVLVNGVAAGQTLPHLSIQLVERKENDGLFPLWAPRRISDEEMGAIENKLKEACQNIGIWEEEKEEKKEEKNEEKKDNDWFKKVFRRVP